MESKESTSPAIPKIRTFADDLKRLNPTAATQPNDSASKPSKPIAIPKAKAARALPDVKHEPAPKPIPKPSLPITQPKTTTPPAFHTLKKTTSGKTPRAIPKKPARDTIEITGSTDEYDNTTIIKDTVRRRSNFFFAIGESLGTAAKDFRRFWKKANQPLYVIPEAERRKGVIQQATSQTGKTFTADYDRLKERLRQRAEQSDIIPEQDITWSPLTEPGFDLLPGDTAWSNPISNVTLEPKRTHTITPAQTQTAQPVPTSIEPPKPKLTLPKKIAPTTPVIPPPVVIEPKPIEAPTPAAPITPVAKPEVPTPLAPKTPTLPTPTTTTPEPALPTPPPTLTPPPIVTPTPDPLPRSDIQEVTQSEAEEVIGPEETFSEEPFVESELVPVPTTTRVASPELINRVTTNTLTVAIAGGLIASVLVVALITRLVGIMWSSPTETTEPVSIPATPLTSLSLSAVPYTITTPEPLLTALTTAATTNQALHELYVTQSEGGDWTPSQLLTAQNISISPAFGASLSDIRWIARDGVIIGIVFRYTNPTQITGSLLAWEAAMGTELGRLLPISNAVTNFTDRQIQQVDVRQSSSGVTYGLVSDTHGVIAVSGEAFTTITSTITQ